VESELKVSQQQLAMSLKTKNEMTSMGHLVESLKRWMINVMGIYEVMLEFRQHLYQTIVLPMLTTKVNEIVGLITTQTDFQLTGQMVDGAIQWMINGDLPARAGGFAMNLNSLCIKIVLSRMLNYSPIVSDCLLLDECFVQSDADKIGEISQFLTGLLSMYGTVVVISHIHSIVDVCELRVMIEKKQGISFVNCGPKKICLPLRLKAVKNQRVKVVLKADRGAHELPP